MTVKEKLPVIHWDDVLFKKQAYQAPTMLEEELRDWRGNELDSNFDYYFDSENREIVAEPELVEYLNEFGLEPSTSSEALQMASEEQLTFKEIKG